MPNNVCPKPSPTVEVCFAIELLPHILTTQNYIVVIVDILRATTSICTALANGAKSIIPVAGVQKAEEMKQKGYLVASESNGVKHDFADFGNSAFNFMTPDIKEKDIVYNTTNGTRAIVAVQNAKGLQDVLIGSFGNLDVLTRFLEKREQNVVILCSGWKGKFCMEDSLFAGALSEKLLSGKKFSSSCDSVLAARMLWENTKDNLEKFFTEIAYYSRMESLGHNNVIPYTLKLNNTPIIPILKGYRLIVESAQYV